MDYDWPGNLRQLDLTLQRTVMFCPGCEINADDIRFTGPPLSASKSQSEAVSGLDVKLRDVPGATADDIADKVFLMLLNAGVPRRQR